ncbi:E3 ubiquitin-protein ligase DTX3L1 [Neoarius graeffei]|uniref:E3 ubiquitin-protein ligase DTX3L1 n=1 Tax=Neoarius graeffei TaxID=443677 RepID=UPI00298C3BE2|nr:E3 ubiquitin-protein ligase DTX3L1 [Neoarius graeffei]XP_060776597.1 E3 ubiquitin-protein ligase DTX3L1 [Neoarius graeffei]
MGSGQSKDKMYCTRYLNGKGPPSLTDQAEKSANGKINSEIVNGNQPDNGRMTITHLRRNVEGYPDCDTIQMNFEFDNGIQTEKHPNPGQKYHGLKTVAFVPQNHEGRKVYWLLEAAFKHKLLFTVATTSTGEEQVTFADIPLKTKASGGHDSFSYPDPKYLKTVKNILNSKGIK